MLRCVLGDGSIFEFDRHVLLDKCGLIRDMLEERDDVEVPLPMIPSRQRMEIVVHNLHCDSTEDFVSKVNDADYLNYTPVLEEGLKILIDNFERSDTYDLEVFVDSLTPQLLKLVMDTVDCGNFVEARLKDVHTFPLSRQLQYVLDNCSRYVTNKKDKLYRKCQIARYFPNVKTDDKDVLLARRVLRKDPTINWQDYAKVAEIACIFGNVEYLAICTSLDVTEKCFKWCALRGDRQMIDMCFVLSLKNVSYDINHRIQYVIDHALNAGHHRLCEHMIHLAGSFMVDKTISSTNRASTVRYLLQRGYKLPSDTMQQHSILANVIDDEELFDKVLNHQNFRQTLEDGAYWISLVFWIGVCRNRHVMERLVDLVNRNQREVKDVENFRDFGRVYQRDSCLFGPMRNKLIINGDDGWKLHDEVVASRQGISTSC